MAGVETDVQPVPSQCSIRLRWTPVEVTLPTAQTSLPVVAETPTRAFTVPGFWVVTTDHAAPFQCSATVRPALAPTAQTSLPEIAATPDSDPLLGLVTTLQADPSQCSVRLEPSNVPTAQTSFVAAAAT